MSENRPAGTRADGRAGSRSAMDRASGARPFKPYAYNGGEREPAAVTAIRLRYRAHQAELYALTEETMPDDAPGYEWQRELGDGDGFAGVRDPEAPAPPPVAAARWCGRCGYLTTAAGHQVMCGE